MSARRVDLDGRPLANKVMDTRCAECGMGTVSAAEFHPYRACELYRESHNSETVWATMEAGGNRPGRLPRCPLSQPYGKGRRMSEIQEGSKVARAVVSELVEFGARGKEARRSVNYPGRDTEGETSMPDNHSRALATHVADGLNELAAYIERDEDVPNHTPASPGFWFYGLAREQRALCRSSAFRKMLSQPTVRALNGHPSLWSRNKTAVVNGIWRAI